MGSGQKKDRQRAIFSFLSMSALDGRDTSLLAIAAHHEPNKTKADNHHRPGRRLRNCRDDGGSDVVKFESGLGGAEHNLVDVVSGAEREIVPAIGLITGLIAVRRIRIRQHVASKD